MKVTILNIIGTYKPCITIHELVNWYRYVRAWLTWYQFALFKFTASLSLFMRKVSLASQLNWHGR